MTKIKRRLLPLALAVIFFILPFAESSLAYLTDTEATVNVMTVGSVKIEQNESQRKFDSSGNTLGLEPYTDSGKILQPTVGSELFLYYSKSPDGSLTAQSEASPYRFLSNSAGESLPLPVDKIVTVKNAGNVPAYVRTIFAFEAPEGMDRIPSDSANEAGEKKPGWTIVYNDDFGGNDSDWKWTFFDDHRFEMATTNAEESKFIIAVAEYQKPLEANEETIPSLLQYYFNRRTNDLTKFGDSLEIYAMTQAVQADGFENANQAFTEAFGQVEWDGSEFKNVPWDQKISQTP